MMITSASAPQREEMNQLLRSGWKSFLNVGLFSLFINLIMLVPPLYMLQVYDRVMASRSEETLLMLTLVLVWMFLTLGILELTRSRVLSRFSNRLDGKLNSRLYGLMMQHALKNPGKVSAQPVADLASVRQFLSGNAPFAFFDTPWIPVYLMVLFLFDPLFGWFALFAAVVLTVLAVLNDFSTRRLQKNASQAQMSASMMVSAQMSNAEVLHAMGMQGALQKRWLEQHLEGVCAQSSAAERSGIWSNASKTLRLMFQSLMLGLGAWLAINNYITAGMVIAGSIIMGRALAPIDQLIGAWKSFAAARLAYQRLNELFSQAPAQTERLSLPAPIGALAVNNAVLMAPDGETPILKGVSFSINAGETLAIIGPSGAGKSSLIRVLIGVWPLGGGDVRLDNTEIQHWNNAELGPYIGYLPQDVELFDGTVAENIARFGELDHTQIVEAAQLADVDALIRRLPEGYDTPIGIAGAALSGGQRQRIGLARALYGDPRLVVLDEPNASLDEQGESALLRACQGLKQRGVTVVMISHRKPILGLADKLLLLDEGRQQLFGPREAVLARMAAANRVPVAPVNSARKDNVRNDNEPAIKAGDSPQAMEG